MDIPIPLWIVRAWNAFKDWGDNSLYVRGRFEIRYIDIVIVLNGIAITGVAWIWYGPIGALQSAAVYCFTFAAGIAFFPRDEA